MSTTPRKHPKQARSKATVDAIVEATIHILRRDGFDRLSTTRVAERAGVSIGSLYQYYPNKIALAAAVLNRCHDRFIAAFRHALDSAPRENLSDSIQAILDATLVSHHLTPDLHGILIDIAPRIGMIERVHATSTALTAVIEEVLREHPEACAPDLDIGHAAAVVQMTLETLAHRDVATHPVRLSGPPLVKETHRLLLGYLTQPMPNVA